MQRFDAVPRTTLVGLVLLFTLSSAALLPAGAEAPAASPEDERATKSLPAEGGKAPMIDVPNANQPAPGLLTAGQPSPQALEEAAAAGYRTVIDLRQPGEIDWDERRVVEDLGMSYVQIPVAVPDGLTVDNARRLAEALDRPDAGPILLHCGSSNRVGALIAIKAHRLDGEDLDTALELGRAAGLTKLEPAVRERLSAED